MNNIQQNTNTNFIGIDLHSDNAHVCVVNSVLGSNGVVSQKILFNKKVSLGKGTEAFFQVMTAFCDGLPHIAAVESTYNWYWMADEFEKRGWNIVLADPSTVSEDKKKATNDKTDAEFLAERLRHGNLRHAKILPKQTRAVRDFIRHRQEYVQERARRKIVLINYFSNHICKRIKGKDMDHMVDLLLQSNREGKIDLATYLKELGFTESAQILKIKLSLSELDFYERLTLEADEAIKELLKEHCDDGCREIVRALKRIKGCGDVLANVIAFEIGDFSRFKSSSQFSSYCRLAPTSKLSNGASKGTGNAKNGNAYLSWAFTELANLMCRFNPEVQSYYDRMFRRQKLRVKTIRTIAAKIARAVWHMLKDKTVFDLRKCFA